MGEESCSISSGYGICRNLITLGKLSKSDRNQQCAAWRSNFFWKETTQKITVNKKPVILTEIYIEQSPDKTIYQEGENFDKTGMKIIAKYSDGSSHEITNYEIIDGDNLQAGTTSITIRYTENGIIRSTTQEITVNEKEEPEPEPEPSKEPVPSNFENAKAKIQEAKIYFNSNDLSILSGEITIKIDGIKIGDESNNYKHYYYLSGTQGDKEIETWKETALIRECKRFSSYGIIPWESSSIFMNI